MIVHRLINWAIHGSFGFFYADRHQANQALAGAPMTGASLMGSFVCCGLSQQLTTHGDRYWRLGNYASEIERGPPVWISEVDWLINKLENIADVLAPERFAPAHNEFPLAFRPISTQAIAIILSKASKAAEIWIERWSSVQPSASSHDGLQYSKYWYCNRPFSSYSRLKLPIRTGWRQALKEFANKW